MSNKDYYTAIWSGMLRQLLGWPEDQVNSWIQKWASIACLDDENDILYHETPQYWLVTTLIPEHLRGQVKGLELVRLQQQLVDAFNDEHRYEFPVDTNWTLFWPRIMEVLKEYEFKHVP